MLSPREATQRANRWRSTPSPTMACFVSSPWLVTAAFRAFRRFSAISFLIKKESELTIVGIIIEHFFHKSSRGSRAASDRFGSSILKKTGIEALIIQKTLKIRARAASYVIENLFLILKMVS